MTVNDFECSFSLIPLFSLLSQQAVAWMKALGINGLHVKIAGRAA
jgi:hypothetical protein